ncbi:MAG: DUF4058 family protein [Phormidesmis sp.]
MPIPFPGMNPYLEHPDLWPSVHQKMIAAIADVLEKRLPSGYKVKLQERHYQVSGEDSLVVGSPGLSWNSQESSQASLQAENRTASLSAALPTSESSAGASVNPKVSACLSPGRPISVLIPVPQKVYETYLEIVNLAGETVTIIEALSPKRKRPGRGRTFYERYREAIFGSAIHFVEIDLLRGWEPPSIYGPDEAGDYRILISRSEERPLAELYTWTVTEAIPQIVLPLSGPDGLPFCLKSVVDQACDRTDLLVNYQQAPLPPLRHHENIWLEDFLQKVGMRPCAS